MTNTIKWDKPCYKCLSHLCDLSCKETSKTEEQDDEVLGFNGWGFPIEKPNKVMTTQTEVLKMALEALETIDGWLLARYPCGLMPKEQEAITAIKEVLAQPEQEPVAEIVSDDVGCLSTKWRDDWTPNEGDKLYTTPTQPKTEQEPVAWMDIDEKGFGYGLRYWSEPDNRHEVPLYTTPPQRTWVGLTDEEIYKAGEGAWYMDELDEIIYAKNIEAKLKEKNK